MFQSETFMAGDLGMKNCSKVSFLRGRTARKCVGTNLKLPE